MLVSNVWGPFTSPLASVKMMDTKINPIFVMLIILVNYQSTHWKTSILLLSTIFDGQRDNLLFPNQTRTLCSIYFYMCHFLSNNTGFGP